MIDVAGDMRVGSRPDESSFELFTLIKPLNKYYE